MDHMKRIASTRISHRQDNFITLATSASLLNEETQWRQSFKELAAGHRMSSILLVTPLQGDVSCLARIRVRTLVVSEMRNFCLIQKPCYPKQ